MDDRRLHTERGRTRELTVDDCDGLLVKVVGVTFVDGYPANLLRLADAWARVEERARASGERWAPSLPAFLVRDPGNEHDPNAVRVELAEAVGVVGHLPRHVAAVLGPDIDAGHRWAAQVLGVLISPGHEDRPGIRLKLRRDRRR